MKVTPAQKADLKKYLMKRMSGGDGVRVLEIQTPLPLDKSDLTKFEMFAGGESVEFTNTVNPELLGGFVLIDGSEKLDVSILGQLNGIVNSLLTK